MRALGTILPLDDLDTASVRLTRLIKAFTLSQDKLDWHSLYIDLSKPNEDELKIEMLIKEIR